MSTNIRIERKCEFCNKAFIAKTTKTRYCTHTCNSRHYKQQKQQEKIQQAKEQEITKHLDVNIYDSIVRKDYLSIKEAALLIGVSERTFFRLMKDGTIQSKKLGRRTIIKRLTIDNLF